MRIKNYTITCTVLAILGLAPLAFSAETEMKSEKKEMSATKGDSMFFKKAAQGGMAEVKLSELAEKNAKGSSTKEFASMMVADHTKANKELMALAETKGVKLPEETDAKHMEKYNMLSKLSGDEFDAAYHKTMLADHEKTVALFEETAKTSKDADVKAFAEKTLPTLKAHLEHCQKMKM